MELKYRLLDHPFYQAWSCGEITKEQLGRYHKSYAEFIELMPSLWAKAVKGLNADTQDAQAIIDDEESHIPLWDEWSEGLPKTESFPRMEIVINAFENMTVSELLGAIHAFEIQQPDVARTKKQGLIEHYGFDASVLRYFDEHMNEAEHIKFGKKLADEFANKDEFKAGFDKGAELIYNALDLYLN